jgi:hypothetical protein
MIDHDHDDEARECVPGSVRLPQIEESQARADAGLARLRKALALIDRDEVGADIAEAAAVAEARADNLFRQQREGLRQACERCPGSTTCCVSLARSQVPDQPLPPPAR